MLVCECVEARSWLSCFSLPFTLSSIIQTLLLSPELTNWYTDWTVSPQGPFLSVSQLLNSSISYGTGFFYMDARNLNLGPHASKANNLCSEEFPNLLFCFHQWFNTNNKCPFTWLPGWKELRHLDCLEEHWASSYYYYFYYKPLGGVCTQLSHRFVENQDVSFIVLNLKYALRASRIKLGNRLYQRA